MKLKYEFENVDVENELYAVPVGTSVKEISGLLVLNHCGSVIIDLLKNDTTEEQMITALAAKYENTIRTCPSLYTLLLIAAAFDFDVSNLTRYAANAACPIFVKPNTDAVSPTLNL